jgi:hypothetical protein
VANAGSPASMPACPDSARTIYVMTTDPSPGSSGTLWRFDPSKATFEPAPARLCQTEKSPGGWNLAPASGPITLAVDRQGDPFIAGITVDETLLHVSEATGACQPTDGLHASTTAFGMAFSSDAAGSDSLYVIQGGDLVSVNVSTFASRRIGAFQAPSTDISTWKAYYLTGTSAGDLFTMVSSQTPPPGCAQTSDCPGLAPQHTVAIDRVDKTTGAVTDEWKLIESANEIWPLDGFAFWGGDFYAFSRHGVWRLRPSDRSQTLVAQAPDVLAAGSSTCAPRQ